MITFLSDWLGYENEGRAYKGYIERGKISTHYVAEFPDSARSAHATVSELDVVIGLVALP